MAVRKHPTRKGGDWWYIVYRKGGRNSKQVYVPFQGTFEEAKIYEQEARLGARPQEEIGPTPQIYEVIPAFMAHYKLDHLKGGIDRTNRSLKILLPFFGNYQFSSITDSIIEQYKTKRLLDNVKPTTINKELAALSSLCKWAHKQKYIATSINIERFPLKKVKAPLPKSLSRAQVEAFFKALKDEIRGLFMAMYFAGLRRNEACSLCCEDIDLFNHTLRVIGKGNKERIIPMVPELEDIIKKRMKVVKKGLLWPAKGGGVRKDLRNIIKWALKRGNLNFHVYPHILRHSFGAHATSKGIGLRALQQLMGHSTPVVTEIYTQVAPATLQNEMRKF